jgi:hypothetical protein
MKTRLESLRFIRSKRDGNDYLALNFECLSERKYMAFIVDRTTQRAENGVDILSLELRDWIRQQVSNYKDFMEAENALYYQTSTDRAPGVSPCKTEGAEERAKAVLEGSPSVEINDSSPTIRDWY